MNEAGALAQPAMDLVDTFDAQLPRGWRHAAAKLSRDGNALIYQALEAAVSEVPPVYPGVGLDPFGWVCATNAALGRLERIVREVGGSWDGSAIECDRPEFETGHVVLRNADGQPALEIRIPSELTRAQLLNDPLLRRLRGSLQQYAAMDTRIVTSFGSAIGSFELGESSALGFVFEDGSRVFPDATLLGSFSRGACTFCWAWANSSCSGGDHSRVLGVRARLEERAGYGALVRPGFFTDEVFAGLVSRLVADECGAYGVFTQEAVGVVYYWALFDRPANASSGAVRAPKP